MQQTERHHDDQDVEGSPDERLRPEEPNQKPRLRLLREHAEAAEQLLGRLRLPQLKLRGESLDADSADENCAQETKDGRTREDCSGIHSPENDTGQKRT